MLFLVLIATTVLIAESRVFYNRFDGGLSSDRFMEQKRDGAEASYDYDANQWVITILRALT